MKAVKIAAHAVITALVVSGVQAAALKPLAAKPSAADIIKESKAADWRALDPENTLYMDLPSGRVVIELAPTFAPNHAANIKALAREHYFDGLAILRSQDNFVVQWGDPDEKNPREPKQAKKTLKGEFTVPMKNDSGFTRLKDIDGYAPQVGHSNGFPVGRDPKTGETWLTHCYAMVGVGFFDKPEMQVPIKAFRVVADLPEAERNKFEVMRTESATYQKVVEAQRNRGGPWTKVAAGHIDLCNAPIPVREAK